MIAQHRKSPVDLLGEDGAGEFVGEGHGGEREELVGAGALVVGEAVVGADQKYQVAAELLVLGENLGELGRVQRFASGVEEDFAGGGVFGEEVEAGGVDFAHFAGGEAGGAFDEFGGEGVQAGIARFADEVKKDFHLFLPW